MKIIIAIGIILPAVTFVDIFRMFRNPGHRRRGWYERFPWMKPMRAEKEIDDTQLSQNNQDILERTNLFAALGKGLEERTSRINKNKEGGRGNEKDA